MNSIRHCLLRWPHFWSCPLLWYLRCRLWPHAWRQWPAWSRSHLCWTSARRPWSWRSIQPRTHLHIRNFTASNSWPTSLYVRARMADWRPRRFLDQLRSQCSPTVKSYPMAHSLCRATHPIRNALCGVVLDGREPQMVDD